ncbi:LysR family transcriptional regulator [Streptomyces sp. 5.8]|uniref:LysR family transcriptional regulator n=1 Tax=Streptomyces sp. 5.8 TaxID=3406571 RepID=UPI003BB65512
MLDPRKLKLLVDVARTGTIAGAALRADVTASAASQQLSALERQTACALLERSGRSVRLTAAGHTLVSHATRVLAEIEAAEEALRDIAGLRDGQLRVATFASAAEPFTVPALAAFRRTHPGLDVSLTELEPELALPSLAAGSLDLAVTHQYPHLPEPDLRGLRQVLLRREKLMLAVPPHARPPLDGPVRLGEFARTAWASTTPSTGFQAVTEGICRAAGFEPDIAFRADSYPMLLSLVAADFAVALVPQSAADRRAEISFHDIAEPAHLVRDIYATVRTGDRSPATESMIRHLARQLGG